MENKRFFTIRQTARMVPIPEHLLRTMKAEGRLPGFAAGTRWYVDYPKLLEMLDKMTTLPE